MLARHTSHRCLAHRQLSCSLSLLTSSLSLAPPSLPSSPLSLFLALPFSTSALSASDEPPRLAKRLHGYSAPTVWEEFTPLSVTNEAVNLGQGFPDWKSPEFVKDAMRRAVEENHNQYTRPGGHPPLVQQIAKRYSESFDREINPMTEVATTVGASEALFACMQSLVNPGDEVVVLEPAFDIYQAQVKVAGGSCKFVPLRIREGEKGKEYYLDIEEFEAAFTDKTAVLLLNTPQNPTGKVFNLEELTEIADVVKKFPKVTVVADEVYEFLTYNRPHLSIATLPGMWERTATISSAGKTFSVTGWKTGWVVGPPDIVRGIVIANQWIMFSSPTVTQAAIAFAMEAASKPYEGFDSYYKWLNAQYLRKRDVMVAALEDAGLEPVVPEGAFFVMGNTASVDIPEKYLTEVTPAAPVMTRDWAFCRWLTIEKGVAAIPPSSFYAPENRELAKNYARFAFCKEDDSLHEAARRLKGLTGPTSDE